MIRYQVAGAYGPAEEDLYRCCSRCGLPIDRDAARATAHTAEDCEREVRTLTIRQACDDRDAGHRLTLSAWLLAYVDPAALPWVTI
jgi:hypothetical protein